MTYNSRNYAHEPLAAVIDALETGAEVLREFDQWIEGGGLQTFGEWLIKATVPEDEQPRVIITPPPGNGISDLKKDPRSSVHPRPTYDPFAHASAAILIVHERLRTLPGTTVWNDLINDVTKVRCHFCNDVLTVENGPSMLVKDHFRQVVGDWYAHHGPNCGRVHVVHNGQEDIWP